MRGCATIRSAMSNTDAKHHRYDVALSFAGEQRAYARHLATLLGVARVRVFYDEDEKRVLWGKNLVEYLHEIYCNEARFCVVFVSEAYAKKRWTTHERRAAQARVLREVTEEYLLPIKVDDTELPGLPDTVAYVSINDGIEEIAKTLLEKLRGRRYVMPKRRAPTLVVSDSTRLGYERQFSHFRTWAAGRGLPSLPSTPEVVATYLAALSEGTVEVSWLSRWGDVKKSRKALKYGTIEHIHAAISHMHRSAGHEWPEAPAITEALKGIVLRKGKTPTRAKPLEITDLKKILAAMRERRFEDLTVIRDKAMISLCFFGALRSFELVSLDVSDLSFIDLGLVVTVRKLKKDEVMATERIPIQIQPDASICPVRSLQRYLQLSELKSGPLFRRIDSRSDAVGAKALGNNSFTVIVKAAAEKAGLDPEQFSGHSLRVGFMTSAAAAGKRGVAPFLSAPRAAT